MIVEIGSAYLSQASIRRNFLVNDDISHQQKRSSFTDFVINKIFNETRHEHEWRRNRFYGCEFHSLLQFRQQAHSAAAQTAWRELMLCGTILTPVFESSEILLC